MTKAITLVQIDLETCSNEFGVSPCTAAIGVTGENKCFNTGKTCQDTVNYNSQTTTLTFAEPNSYLPADLNAIPCIDSVSFQPASVSLGQDLGQRATLTITMKDFRDSDVGIGRDPYHDERSYNPYEQGTFWGKFRARQPFLRSKNVRLLRGFEGDSIDDFEKWHFTIESFDGPSINGKYQLIAKDILKFADGDRSQAPALSGGFLTASLTSSATTFSINPAGVGDTDYPASGLVAVGGKEIMSFTRVGNDFTVVRAQNDTDAVEHDADSRAQLCLVYTAQDPANIINDLFVNYAGIDPAFIDLTAWTTETGAFLGTVYSSVIAEPNSIKKLVSELIEQAALSLFWEPLTQQIKLKVLRAITTDADTFDLDKILKGSFTSKEQPNKRISQVWTYFARTNPLSQLDQAESYRSTIITIDAEAETETEYGTPIIKKIFSRWIPLGGRSIASRLNDIQLSRYRDPPRKFTFKLFYTENITLGEGYQLGSYQLQNELGEETLVPIQVTQLSKDASKYSVASEESLFKDLAPVDPNDHTIILDSNSQNLNLKSTHDALFGAGSDGAGVVVSVYVETGVIIGSDDTATTAFDVGSGWNAATQIDLYVRGRIQGKGGRGGNSGGTGQAGGDAFTTTRAINVDFENAAGEIWSGGGGGGGATAGQGSSVGGGGGTGQTGGNAGSSNPAGLPLARSPQAGTNEAGGLGGIISNGSFTATGGTGGGAGLNGSSGSANAGGSGAAGGAAGDAIDGVSFVTFLNDGSKDIRGNQVN